MGRERLNGNGADFRVSGCPAADGKGGCVITCAGGWPGTKITTEKMTEAVIDGKIIPERLGCGTLERNARYGIQELERLTNISDNNSSMDRD